MFDYEWFYLKSSLVFDPYRHYGPYHTESIAAIDHRLFMLIAVPFAGAAQWGMDYWNREAQESGQLFSSKPYQTACVSWWQDMICYMFLSDFSETEIALYFMNVILTQGSWSREIRSFSSELPTQTAESALQISLGPGCVLAHFQNYSDTDTDSDTDRFLLLQSTNLRYIYI